MKNYRIHLLLILIVVITTSFYLVIKDFERTLSYSSELLKLIFSFITLIIAINIYDQFGLNKKLTEKRVELIIELLTEIKKISFRAQIKSGVHMTNINFLPSKDIKNYLKNNSIFENTRVLFKLRERDEIIYKILLIKNNPILPKVISEKLEFIEPKTVKTPEKSIEFNNAKIYFSKDGESKLFEEKDWFVEFENNCTLKEYINKYEILFIEIEKWINKHSNLDDKLNI